MSNCIRRVLSVLATFLACCVDGAPPVYASQNGIITVQGARLRVAGVGKHLYRRYYASTLPLLLLTHFYFLIYSTLEQLGQAWKATDFRTAYGKMTSGGKCVTCTQFRPC